MYISLSYFMVYIVAPTVSMACVFHFLAVSVRQPVCTAELLLRNIHLKELYALEKQLGGRGVEN